MLMLSVRKLGCIDVVTQVSNEKEITVGRHRDCDVVLDDGTVAGKHCQLIVGSRGIVVIDLGSSNGTFVNSKRISRPVILSARDTLEVSSFSITVRSLREQSLDVPKDGERPHRSAA